MFDYMYNDKGVLCEVKYSKKELKSRLNFLLLLNFVFVFGLIFLIIMHIYEDASIYIAYLWVVVTTLGDIALISTHISLVKFRLLFNQEGLCVYGKKRRSIKYNELEIILTMHRVGTSSFEDLLNSYSSKVDNKNTICLSKDKNLNFEKINRKVRTSRGADHGFYKETFYLCDYRGSRIFDECIKTIEYYYPCNIKKVSLDRDQL